MVKKILIFLVAVIIVAGIFVYSKISIFTIQPIGLFPNGVTAIVWKKKGDPFFNSADAICLKQQGYVNLLCRGMVLGNYFDKQDIIYKLPYSESAYLRSINGKSY